MHIDLAGSQRDADADPTGARRVQHADRLSYNELEFSEPEHCAAGANVLLCTR